MYINGTKADSKNLLKIFCNNCKTERSVKYIPDLNRRPNCKKCSSNILSKLFAEKRKNKIIIKKIPKRRNIKFTFEEVKQISKNIGFEYIDNYYNNARIFSRRRRNSR